MNFRPKNESIIRLPSKVHLMVYLNKIGLITLIVGYILWVLALVCDFGPCIFPIPAGINLALSLILGISSIILSVIAKREGDQSYGSKLIIFGSILIVLILIMYLLGRYIAGFIGSIL